MCEFQGLGGVFRMAGNTPFRAFAFPLSRISCPTGQPARQPASPAARQLAARATAQGNVSTAIVMQFRFRIILNASFSCAASIERLAGRHGSRTAKKTSGGAHWRTCEFQGLGWVFHMAGNSPFRAFAFSAFSHFLSDWTASQPAGQPGGPTVSRPGDRARKC